MLLVLTLKNSVLGSFAVKNKGNKEWTYSIQILYHKTQSPNVKVILIESYDVATTLSVG